MKVKCQNRDRVGKGDMRSKYGGKSLYRFRRKNLDGDVVFDRSGSEGVSILIF